MKNIDLPPGLVQEVIELACSIQQVPAPTHQEEARARYLAELFTAEGLQDVQMDVAGNVLARLPGGGQPPLVISAHLDTVHPITTNLSLQRSAERISGAGIGDNSLGLAGLLGLARWQKCQKTDLPGDVWLAANTCEEGLGNLRGMRAIVDRFAGQPIAYLILEGIGLGNVLHRGLGVERFRLTVRAPGGHSWADYGQPSAIHEIARILHEIASLVPSANPRTSLNIGTLEGGTSVNTIAAQAWADIDLRSEDTTALQQIARQVSALACSTLPGVQVTLSPIGSRPAGEIARSHPLVQNAAAALRQQNISANTNIASTDANIPLSRGYPAICIGLTTGGHVHTTTEYINLQPLPAGLAQLILCTLTTWQALRPRRRYLRPISS